MALQHIFWKTELCFSGRWQLLNKEHSCAWSRLNGLVLLAII